MLFTQRTQSTEPMTKDVMAKMMENPHYLAERIKEIKNSPKQKQVLDMIWEKHPQR